VIVFGPDEQQVRVHLATLLGSLAVGKQPEVLPAGTAKDAAEQSSDLLATAKGCGGEGTEILMLRDRGSGDSRDALPGLEAAVALAGQPENETAVIRSWFAEHAGR
jgi:hypothetical protein